MAAMEKSARRYDGNMPKSNAAGNGREKSPTRWLTLLLLAGLATAVAWIVRGYYGVPAGSSDDGDDVRVEYRPREVMDASGFTVIRPFVRPWQPTASLADIGAAFEGAAARGVAILDRQLAAANLHPRQRLSALFTKARFEPRRAAEELSVLAQARSLVKATDPWAEPLTA
jgi:hypothetical protein